MTDRCPSVVATVGSNHLGMTPEADVEHACSELVCFSCHYLVHTLYTYLTFHALYGSACMPNTPSGRDYIHHRDRLYSVFICNTSSEDIIAGCANHSAIARAFG